MVLNGGKTGIMTLTIYKEGSKILDTNQNLSILAL
jgi:hypothetical protein